MAVVSGLADSKQFPSIFKVFQTKEYASPYMEKYVTEALFLMGKGEYGLQRMKKRFKEMLKIHNVVHYMKDGVLVKMVMEVVLVIMLGVVEA